MSYAHTQRRKLIKRLKRQYEDGDSLLNSGRWYPYFKKCVEDIKREFEGPPLGSIEEIMFTLGGIK